MSRVRLAVSLVLGFALSLVPTVVALAGDPPGPLPK
jgi:hypothetical protein